MRASGPPRSWHGDPGLKAEVLGRMERHRTAGTLVQGAVFQRLDPAVGPGYQGDVIGAMLPLAAPGSCVCGDLDCRDHINGHREVERRYGIPYRIALAIDDIFHCLAPQRCTGFAITVIQAVPVGVDLRPLLDRTESLRDDLNADGVRLGGRGTDLFTCAEEHAARFLGLLAGRPGHPDLRSRDGTNAPS